jgi:hypothetical protein
LNREYSDDGEESQEDYGLNEPHGHTLNVRTSIQHLMQARESALHP